MSREMSTIHAKCLVHLHSNTTSGEVSTVHVEYYCSRRVSVQMLCPAQHQLHTESTLVTCIQTLHLAYITYPTCTSVGMLFLARCQLSMQSIRLNTMSGKVNYLCRVPIWTLPLMRGQLYMQRILATCIQTLYLAVHQQFMKSKCSHTISHKISTVHVIYPRNLCLNATSGRTPTIHAEYVPRSHRNVERNTNYYLHVACAFEHYVWQVVNYPHKVLLQLLFKRFVWRDINYPHRIPLQLLYGCYVWCGIHIHEVWALPYRVKYISLYNLGTTNFTHKTM